MNREKIRERLTINAIIEHCDRKTRMYEKACDVKYLETAVMGNGIKAVSYTHLRAHET